MNRKKHLIFVGLMGLIFAILVFIPTFLVDRTPLKEGHFILIIIAIFLLILLYYRTGSSIVFLGMCLHFIMDRVHLSVIGEDGVQEIIDRKVNKRIKKFEGNN